MAQEYSGPDLEDALGILTLRSGIDRPIRLSLGGCAEAIGTDRSGAMRRSAHAHVAKADPMRGWACFKSPNIARAITPTRFPTRLLVHEWAHLATWQGHTARWRALMRQLGHPADAKRMEDRQKAYRERQGQLLPCPVLAAGVACPFSDKPNHRHSERLLIHVDGVLYKVAS